MEKLGTHISKRPTFLSTLQDFYEKDDNVDKPVQIFTGSPKFWRRSPLSAKDVDDTKKYVKQHNLRVYIHSIYLVNLSKPVEEFMEKGFEYLRWELENGHKMGFRGVVVHCGKSCKLEKGKALENMYANMARLIPYISPSCPLLLETSAGQGTELCWKYDDFNEFYGIFGEGEKQHIKICIDTCHVFAAGHDPLKFLEDWERDNPGSLVLVHFNDSKFDLGKRKDRHEIPGDGYIGMEKMQKVAEWCEKHNYPIVGEFS